MIILSSYLIKFSSYRNLEKYNYINQGVGLTKGNIEFVVVKAIDSNDMGERRWAVQNITSIGNSYVFEVKEKVHEDYVAVLRDGVCMLYENIKYKSNK